MPVQLLAHIEAKPGQEAALTAVLQTLVDASRRESTCIQYDLWRDQDQPTVFVMVERWASLEATEVHGQTPHFQAFLRDSPPLLAKPLAVKHYVLAA